MSEYKLPELDYKVISSGSKGNAVRIEDIMIDCGVPYKHMKEELNKCRFLFITHKHCDHMKERTLEQIRKYHKNIKIAGNYEVAQTVKVDMISGEKAIRTKRWKIKPFYVPHNVVCQGIAIKFDNELDVIYVTDSAGTKSWQLGRYDYLFIESNYDENKLKMINQKEYGYDVVNASMRHTSCQESKAFYYMNRKGKDSKWVELHKSERFY